MKIKLLYYSGAGNTKFIASIVANKLIKNGHIVESIRVTEKSISTLDDDFDILYLGFPVYFRDAPELIYNIFDKINGKNRSIMIFVITGLYSGNAFKNIQSVSIEKGFIPVGALQLIMPGTDFLTLGVKANSFLEKLYLKNHSRNINGKVEKFVEKMEKIKNWKEQKLNGIHLLMN